MITVAKATKVVIHVTKRRERGVNWSQTFQKDHLTESTSPASLQGSVGHQRSSYR